MASGTFEWYLKGVENMANGDIDWAADTIYVMLCTASHTIDQINDNDVADLDNEVANGNGYTTGGQSVGTHTTDNDATSKVRLKISADAEWTSSSFTARHVILYKYTGTPANDLLIGYCTLDADVTSDNGTWTADFDQTNGVLYIDVA